MTKIFPDAKDYKTIVSKIEKEQLKRIEDQLGFKLLPGQRDNFQYFEMTGEGGKTIGYIIAASQKGEFGAIEFVVGFDNDYLIKDMYIQRSRERDQSFKERAFLDLFKGSALNNWKEIASVYKGKRTTGIDAVINGLMKEFVTFKEVAQHSKNKLVE